MVDRGVIPDIAFALSVIASYDGPVTRRRVVTLVVMAAGVSNEFPTWRACAPGTAASIGRIVSAVCAWRGVSTDAVSGRGGGTDVAMARGFAAWCCKRGFGYPLSMIGDRLGGRGHTTILQAINKIDMITDRQPAVRSILLSLCDDTDDASMDDFYGNEASSSTR